MIKSSIYLLLFISFNSTAIFAQAKNSISCSCNVDKDGDGISDCFDQCPKTPPGASVNSHGCPMDTDGDGVPDYLDKQLITPTECQPSDHEGVSSCDCPCPRNNFHFVCGPTMGQVTIYFLPNSSELNGTSKILLAKYASKMRANPSFRVAVIGYDNVFTTAQGQQLAWDHVHTTISYLHEKEGIDKERFIFLYGESLNNSQLILRDAKEGEEGPHILPPPFPGLSKEIGTK